MSINSAFYNGTGAAFAAAGDLAFPVTIVKRNEVYDWNTSSTTVSEVRLESRAIRFESSQGSGTALKMSLVIDWRDRPERIDPSDAIEFGGKTHRFSNLTDYTYFYQVDLDMTIDVAQRWIDGRIGSLVSENILDSTKIPLDYVRPVEGEYYIRAGVAGLGSKIASYDDPERSGFLVLQVFYRISRGEILTELSPLTPHLEMQMDGNFRTGALSVNFLGADPRDSTLNRLDLMLPYTVYG